MYPTIPASMSHSLIRGNEVGACWPARQPPRERRMQKPCQGSAGTELLRQRAHVDRAAGIQAQHADAARWLELADIAIPRGEPFGVLVAGMAHPLPVAPADHLERRDAVDEERVAARGERPQRLGGELAVEIALEDEAAPGGHDRVGHRPED